MAGQGPGKDGALPDIGRLRWYLHRLRAMSLAEVGHRLQEQGRRLSSRFASFDPARHLQPGAEDHLPVLPGFREGLVAIAAEGDLAAQLAARAQAVADGDIRILGRRWPVLAGIAAEPGIPVPDWHFDAGSGAVWPADRYCFDIQFRHAAGPGSAGIADPKYVWELNRLTYLQAVAAHACLSGSAEARQLCIAHLDDWIARNPPFAGINWVSGIELAIRSVSLMAVLSLLEPQTLPRDLRHRLAGAIAAHAFWLRRFPSLHSSANNHLVAELAGLFLLGTLFRPLRPGARWAADARRMLEAEAHRQILDDGAGAEQSPGYAALTLEWYAVCAIVADRSGHPLDGACLDRMAKAARWLRALSDTSGGVPDIGDSDGSSLFLREVPQAAYPSAVRGVVAQVTGQPELAPVDPVPGLRHALFGLPGPGQPAAPGLHRFDDGGMSVLRWRPGSDGAGQGRIDGHPPPDSAMLVFDHGPLGYLSIAAHGHADALAIWLHLDGRPVLVDAGTWLYLGAAGWRDHFRGTAAHNTLAVGGADSSRPAGPFNWASRAGARLIGSNDTAGQWQVAAEHDGYLASNGCLHRRTVRCDRRRCIEILDELVGPGTAGPDSRLGTMARAESGLEVEIGFQFAAGLLVLRDGDDWQVERDGCPVLRLRGPSWMTAAVDCGSVNPPRGWVSPAFGERREAPRLAFRGPLPIGETSRITLTIE